MEFCLHLYVTVNDEINSYGRFPTCKFNICAEHRGVFVFQCETISVVNR